MKQTSENQDLKKLYRVNTEGVQFILRNMPVGMHDLPDDWRKSFPPSVGSAEGKLDGHPMEYEEALRAIFQTVAGLHKSVKDAPESTAQDRREAGAIWKAWKPFEKTLAYV